MDYKWETEGVLASPVITQRLDRNDLLANTYLISMLTLIRNYLCSI